MFGVQALRGHWAQRQTDASPSDSRRETQIALLQPQRNSRCYPSYMPRYIGRMVIHRGVMGVRKEFEGPESQLVDRLSLWSRAKHSLVRLQCVPSGLHKSDQIVELLCYGEVIVKPTKQDTEERGHSRKDFTPELHINLFNFVLDDLRKSQLDFSLQYFASNTH